ncbi:CoA transferase [Kineosporia succinea]|uniref:Crotonobetainyl-CoA:carnitine CoA-transferase CaiB-like acyl-CoA transferase n=1 Tax=Kineosporia succinea TaxID=84632 RepID=A0ABT9P946_9ACTN|nr:CoA transferase [Kineosporia succinea]MDP9829222.1 crotonobetainyl-CoA:carnitine CoA-transferase CaiB-like acyl-CoA transferase [Kineosporia succinea]
MIEAVVVPEQILPPVEIDAGEPGRGPRRWWGGPLDVEGLALASVGLAGAAVDTLVGRPGALRASPPRIAAAFDSLGHLEIVGPPGSSGRGGAPGHLGGFATLSGFFATADGWIRTHANYPHHEQRLRQALGVATADQVPDALRRVGALEAERLIDDAGGIAAAVRTRKQWLDSPMAAGPPPREWISFDVVPGPGSPWRPGDLPLAGLRVLDLTRVIAGPIATRSLAALGADVLRIDPPSSPELEDQHVDSGFGKRTAVLDLGADPDTLHDLLSRADVLVNGYRNGGLDRFGLDRERLRERYPSLIVVNLDAWGTAGPWAGRRGFDSIVQAATGIADVYRQRGGRPGALPVQALDHATGYGIVAATVGLADARRRHGVTGSAELSLVRAADLLFRSRPPRVPVEPIPDPGLVTTASDYGELRHVPSPFDLYGVPLAYPTPPHRYGSDAPRW